MRKKLLATVVAIAAAGMATASSASADSLASSFTEVNVTAYGQTCVSQFDRYDEVTVWVMWCDDGFQDSGSWSRRPATE